MKTNMCLVCMTIVAALLVCAVVPSHAQRIVNVPEGIGTLEQTINADSTNRKGDPSTVYVLARNGYYGTLVSLQNTDHVYIRAAYGTGAMPYIRPSLPTVGSATRPFAPKGNLTLRGVYIVAKDDHPTAPTQIISCIRPTAAGLRIVVDSCHIDQDGGSAVRLDNGNNRVFLTNSILSNFGDMNSANGRVIDTRGVNQDTLVIQNCIIYNVTEKLVRTGTEGATGTSTYFAIDHNTIINCPYNTQFNFGKAKAGRFTNNLMYNAACTGDTSTTGGWLMADPRTDVPQSIVVANNNYYIDSAITNAYAGIAPPFSLYTPKKRRWMDTCVTRLSSGLRSQNDSTMFGFTLSIPSLKQVIIAQHDTSLKVTSNQKPNLPSPGGSIEWNSTHYVLNTTYATQYWFYTGGLSGERIGSLLDWKVPLTDVRSSGSVPSSMSLSQNYPNPFNPVTSIRYSVGVIGLPAGQAGSQSSVASTIRLAIYDLLGREVVVLVNEPMSPGSYEVKFNGAGLSSGVYFCRMEAGDFSAMQKMILMK
jgi:hypothetical protein